MRAWLQQQQHGASTRNYQRYHTASLLSHSACAHPRRAIKRQQQVRADLRAADVCSTSGDGRNDDWDVDQFMQLLKHRRLESTLHSSRSFVMGSSNTWALSSHSWHAQACAKPAHVHARPIL
jgi:hypothetical protein